MNWTGIVVGAAAFLIIGIFHPIVIYCEYWFTYKVWPFFLVGGLIACFIALHVESLIASTILGIAGFSMFWSIGELKEQANRVERGWFPENPKRKR